MKSMTWIHGALIGLVLPSSSFAAHSRAFILDKQARSLAAVDTSTGEVVGRAALEALEGHPVLLRTPDGARLLVLDQGAGGETVCCGFKPKGKSFLTLVDTASMKPIQRVELGWGLGGHAISADGRRLTVFCPGYESKKPEEARPQEVISIDLAGAAVLARVALERRAVTFLPRHDGRIGLAFAPPLTRKGVPPTPAHIAIVDLEAGKLMATHSVERASELMLTPDERQAILFGPRQAPKKGPSTPASLQFLDVASGALGEVLSLEGDPKEPAFSPDGRYLYLLEAGKVDKKPERTIAGRIQVFAVEARAHQGNLDAGLAPRGLLVHEKARQVYVLSDGPASKEPAKPQGELRVIRGAEITATIPVARVPRFLQMAPDGERLYVIGEEAVTKVDPVALRALSEVPLKAAGGGPMAAGSKHPVTELAVSPEGERGFALYSGSNKLTVLDLEKLEVVNSVNTGRGGVKFGKLMASIAAATVMTALSYQGALMQARASGIGFYNVYSPGAFLGRPSSSVIVRPDGKFAYALNSQTKDVTIVESEKGTVVEKIGGGGSSLDFLPGDKIVAVQGGRALHLIDAEKNTKLAEIAFEGADAVSLIRSSDGQHVLGVGGKDLYCLEGSTGKVVRHTTERADLVLAEPESAQEAASAPAPPVSAAEPESPEPHAAVSWGQAENESATKPAPEGKAAWSVAEVRATIQPSIAWGYRGTRKSAPAAETIVVVAATIANASDNEQDRVMDGERMFISGRDGTRGRYWAVASGGSPADASFLSSEIILSADGEMTLSSGDGSYAIGKKASAPYLKVGKDPVRVLLAFTTKQSDPRKLEFHFGDASVACEVPAAGQ